MKAIVASLTRLYKANKINNDVLKTRVQKGTITKDEYKEITGEEYKN